MRQRVNTQKNNAVRPWLEYALKLLLAFLLSFLVWQVEKIDTQISKIYDVQGDMLQRLGRCETFCEVLYNMKRDGKDMPDFKIDPDTGSP